MEGGGIKRILGGAGGSAAGRSGKLIKTGAKERRWSKALVRHGANGPAALAAVLGELAEELAVRGDASSARS